MQRLHGKNIVVFGSASGLGAASARRLASEGASVCLADTNIDGARSVADMIARDNGEAIAVHCDIADEASPRAAVAALQEAFGPLDGAHINAADMRVLSTDLDAVDIDLDIFDRTLAVNLRGHLLCTRAIVPSLLSNGGGAIVYTSSPAAEAAEPTRVAYAVSKAGLNALMRHVASRWGREGITANCIAPGVTPTEASTASVGTEFEAALLARTPHTRLGIPNDQAAMVAMLMSDDGRWINGQVYRVDGGMMM